MDFAIVCFSLINKAITDRKSTIVMTDTESETVDMVTISLTDSAFPLETTFLSSAIESVVVLCPLVGDWLMSLSNNSVVLVCFSVVVGLEYLVYTRIVGGTLSVRGGVVSSSVMVGREVEGELISTDVVSGSVSVVSDVSVVDVAMVVTSSAAVEVGEAVVVGGGSVIVDGAVVGGGSVVVGGAVVGRGSVIVGGALVGGGSVVVGGAVVGGGSVVVGGGSVVVGGALVGGGSVVVGEAVVGGGSVIVGGAEVGGGSVVVGGAVIVCGSVAVSKAVEVGGRVVRGKSVVIAISGSWGAVILKRRMSPS